MLSLITNKTAIVVGKKQFVYVNVICLDSFYIAS